MKVLRNTADDVKFTHFMLAPFVPAVEGSYKPSPRRDIHIYRR